MTEKTEQGIGNICFKGSAGVMRFGGLFSVTFIAVPFVSSGEGKADDVFEHGNRVKKYVTNP